MKLDALVATSRETASTRSRLEKTAKLADLLSCATTKELPIIVRYLSGKLPGGRLGVGHRSLNAVTGVTASSSPRLEVLETHQQLESLRALSGAGSNDQRAEALRELYRSATEPEQAFLSRLLIGDLRQGSLEGIMVEAIASAFQVPSGEVRRAVMLAGDLGDVARAAKLDGAEGLAGFQLQLFRPVQPMLAQTAEDVEDALATLGESRLEHKLDGARIQVHKSGDEVRVFTRRLNEVTVACPEIVESVSALEVESIVLDGEAVALKNNGRPYPFQVTMRRFGRRLDVAQMRQALPLTSTYFDCLYLNGESLIDQSARERFRRLEEHLPEELRITTHTTDDVERAESFEQWALSLGHEGVMVKDLDSTYEAGSRGKSWLKVKTARTLDLVVLAAEWGSGRRKGWLSNLHLGALDPDTGELVMLGKTFKGMTDEILKWQTARLQELEVSRDDWVVYVRPELVVEIAFNDIQKSPHYAGGLALRFARLKAYREDKGPEDADTIEAVHAIFEEQTGERPDAGENQPRLPGF